MSCTFITRTFMFKIYLSLSLIFWFERGQITRMGTIYIVIEQQECENGYGTCEWYSHCSNFFFFLLFHCFFKRDRENIFILHSLIFYFTANESMWKIFLKQDEISWQQKMEKNGDELNYNRIIGILWANFFFQL
jgi:hypothetical protein